MEKQIQFIKHKAGIALSLFLLLINQMAAQANTCSDKTKWLTNNLEKTDKTDPSLISLKALSAKPDRPRKVNSIIVSCSDDPNHIVKLRPFMANRKLPSRRDLELALTEQKAKLAEENNARLNGQISTFIVGDDNRSQSYTPSYTNKTNFSARQNTTQLNNGNRNYTNRQIASKSAQTNFSLMKQAEQHLFSSNRQQAPQYNSSISGAINNPEPLTTNLPPDSGNSQAIPATSINLLSDESGPSAFSLPAPALSAPPQFASSGFGAAGPPPFPLNLLPEASLKQLVKTIAGRRTSSANTQQVAFGSWHSASTLSSMSGNHVTNLPYAGFQSHLSKANTRNTKKINSRHISALPAVTGSPIKSGAKKQKTYDSTSKKDTSARNRMLLESQVRVAAYPTYATQSLRPWNFAQ